MEFTQYILGFLHGGLRVLEVVLLFSILIIAHEFGHYITAKASGMWVEEFAIGFGKKLFSRKIGETVYSVNLIPIGGYNKIYGMDVEELEDASYVDKKSKVKEDEGTTGKKPSVSIKHPPDYSLAPADDPRAFVNRPIYQRFAVAIAGSVANLLVAILIVFLMGVTIGFPATEIGTVIPGGPADVAGLMRGDIITHLDGVRLSSRQDLHRAILFSNGSPLEFTGMRGNEPFTETVIPQPTRLVDSFFCRIGFVYLSDGMIIYVLPDSPAERAKLNSGDIIIEVDSLRFPSHRLEIENGSGSLPFKLYSGFDLVDIEVIYFESEINHNDYSPFGFFYDDDQIITQVIPTGIADEAGLLPGDRILGGVTETWTETIPGESALAAKPTTLEYERDGTTLSSRLEPDSAFSQILVQWDDATLPVLSSLPYNHRLSQAGLSSGDKIVSINGVATPNGISALIELERNVGENISIVALVENEERVFSVHLPLESDREGLRDFFSGIHFKTRYFSSDFSSSLVTSVSKSRELTGFIFMMIGWLFSGQASLDDLAGPVGIMDITYKAASSGFVDLINIMVLLSINLAIFNLLPFPALDGGRIVFMILEAIFRRPVLNVRVENIIHLAGFVLLILLALFVTYHDIARLVFGQ